MIRQVVVAPPRKAEHWCYERGLTRNEMIRVYERGSERMLDGVPAHLGLQVTQLEPPESRAVAVDLRMLLRRARPERRGGLLIAFEGGEGAGKSTQLKLLADLLWRVGQDVVLTREPGGTRAGHTIRRILLDDAYVDPPDERAEALLFATDRAHHVASVVRPWLGLGAVVLTDRYVDSSIAYQVGGRGLDEEQVRALSAFATDGLVPDLTVLLDVPVADGMARARERGALTKIDAYDARFHKRVRAQFLALAKAEPDRYLVVDALRSEREVAEAVAEAVTRLLVDRQMVGESLRNRDILRPAGERYVIR